MRVNTKKTLRVAGVVALATLFVGCSMSGHHNADNVEMIEVKGASIVNKSDNVEVSVKVRLRREIDIHKAQLQIQRRQQIFKRYGVNPTVDTVNEPVSTFSMDVDDGAYQLAANMLQRNLMPNADGIRVEEFVNAMPYSYHPSEQTFGVSAQAMPSPFRQGFHVLHVGLQTNALAEHERAPSNLVLVADVSGSMNEDNKLGLLKDAFTTLVSQLGSEDTIAIVSYANESAVVLPATKASNKREIFKAIRNLSAGGGTNAARGIEQAYMTADQMFKPGYNNRVILTSDGMANAGSTDPKHIVASIEHYKQKGIFLTTVGVGLGMYNDHLLEQLADTGNGNYLYFGDQKDIQSAFVDGLGKQLQAVAKDARIQVTFNPEKVSSYRLLGYENRAMDKEDFTDKSVDGGEIGAGHRVTAIYEVKLNPTANNDAQLGDIKVAWKKPLGHKLQYIAKSIPGSVVVDAQSASDDTKLSVAVAAFAEKLRQSYWSRAYGYGAIRSQITGLGTDYQRQATVQQVINMIDSAARLDYRQDPYNAEMTVGKMNFNRVPLLD